MKNKEESIEVAVQIVWEYEGWGAEHVHDMLATYDKGLEPCSSSELYELCENLQVLKDRGVRSNAARKELTQSRN